MKKLVLIMAIALLSVGAYGRDFVSPAGSVISPGNGNPIGGDKSSEINPFNLGCWPVEEAWIPFVPQALCKFDVKMAVGFWVQIDNCKDLEMKLKQTAIHEYTGCTQLKVSTNTDVQLSAEFAKTDSNLSYDGIDWGWVSSNPVGTAGDTVAAKSTGAKVNLTMKLKKVNINQMAANTGCNKVGEITIKVKPLVKFSYNCSDCGSSGECPPVN